MALHVMQRGAALEQWPRDGAIDFGTDDVEETARRMQSLDWIISVDTFPAHLAGALGIPVWTLLPHEPDWRWMIDRDDSPWYPTMRLFRQPKAGDWSSVIGAVCDQLQSIAAINRR